MSRDLFFLVVNEDLLALQTVVQALKVTAGVSQVNALQSPTEALEWVKENKEVDAVFLEVVMKEMNGLQLGHERNIISKRKNMVALVVESVSCDYYDQERNPHQKVHYNGEYMSQYSWSEYTHGKLEDERRKSGENFRKS